MYSNDAFVDFEGAGPQVAPPANTVQEVPQRVRSLTLSKEYKELIPQDREALIKKFLGTSEEKQASLLTKLTYDEGTHEFLAARPRDGLKEGVTKAAKGLGAGVVSSAISAPAAALAMVPHPAAKVGALALEPVLNYAGRRANVALGLEEEGTFGDIASVALPLGLRTAGTVTKAYNALGKAPQAIRDANELTAKDQKRFETEFDTYQTKARDNAFKYQKKLEVEQQRADAVTDANIKKYDEQITNIDRRVAKANQTTLDAHQAKLQTYDDIKLVHETSAIELKRLPGSLAEKETSKAIYASITNTEVPLTKARDTAKFVLQQIEEQLPAFRDGHVAKVAKDIRDFGVSKETPQAPSGLVDPSGRPVSTEPPAPEVPKNPRFAEFQKMLSNVGELKGTLESRDKTMRGLVSELYKSTRHDLLSAPDSMVGPNRDKLLKANSLYKRERAIEDLAEVITPATSFKRPEDDAIQVNATGIRTGLNNLVRKNTYFADAFKPGELEKVQALVEKWTHISTLPRPPGQAPAPKSPDYSSVKAPETGQVERIPAPELPTFPDPVQVAEPQLKPLSLRAMGSAAILGHAAGGTTAYLTGGNYPTISTVGTVAGGAIPALSHTIAGLMLSPQGRPFLDKIMSGKQFLTSSDIAFLSTTARKLGAIPFEKEETGQP